MSTGSGRLEDLLQPSLTGSKGRGSVALYSLRACFFVAFFGGVPAIVFFSALNSQRLGRLGKDAVLYVLVLAGFVAFMVAVAEMRASDTWPAWIEFFGDGGRGLRIVSRLSALALFGSFYLMHRPYFVASTLSSDPYPNPWGPGIACTLLGTGFVAAVEFVRMQIQ